jgi:hypothetical protein
MTAAPQLGGRDGVSAISVEKLLEVVRLKGGALPQRLAAHLFCAAVWRGAVAGTSLRPRLILLDPLDGLRLEPANRASSVERENGYLAPEVLAGGAATNDPQVLVYAAGALGYELLAGEPPPAAPVRMPAELAGPLGEVVRVAMAPQRRDRFQALEQMSEALHAIHPAPAPELEKLLFTSLYGLCSRWVPERSPPLIPAEATANGNEGRDVSETATVFRWMYSMDAAVEQIQRQQLELVAALASPADRSSRALEAGPPDAHKTRERDHLELLQRIAALGSSQTEAPEPVRKAPSLWLNWGGAALAGALGAFGVVVALGITKVATVPDARTPPAPPQAAVEPAPPPAAPRPPPMMTSPMILSGSKAAQPAAAEEKATTTSEPAASPEPVKEAKPSPAPAPATPPRAPAKRSKTRTASSGTRALVESGERALRRGRPADALVAFQSALAVQPTLARAVRGAAMAQMMQGKEREAKEGFKQYLRLAPRAEDAPRIEKVIENLDAEPTP